MNVSAPPLPVPMLAIGVTGHRSSHPVYAANAAAIAATLERVLALASRCAGGRMRVNTLLADGADQTVATYALERGWDLFTPLPLGARLNAAVNAGLSDAAQVRSVLEGRPTGSPEIDARIAAIEALAAKSGLIELAERDEKIAALLLAHLERPADGEAARVFLAELSCRVALAGRILIEQSDVVIGVWDGLTTAHVGGTGHTMARALEAGTPVIWIDPARPDGWTLLRSPEALLTHSCADPEDDPDGSLCALLHAAMFPAEGEGCAQGADHPGPQALNRERWHPRSRPLAHAYRRVEAMFGGGRPLRSVRQVYENPDSIGAGSGAALLEQMRALPQGDSTLPARIEQSILRRYAWADGISAHLSDSYRGGMTVSFILSSFAIVGGSAYLPFVGPDHKWPFALFELSLLVAILAITSIGQKRRWHARWFETRRVAEYLRHSPLLLILGVARAPGRWPRGTETSWPEWYARQAIREVGIPTLRIGEDYLRAALAGPVSGHVASQREYHFAKANRLKRVHNRLDHLSDWLFRLAVASVALYLALKGASMAGVFDAEALNHMSKYFTVLGVVFPTFGAGIAGIRYFGDFERFAAISEITAEKLEAIGGRIELLLNACEGTLDYAAAAELARATDDTVFAEIENWQSVFGGKNVTIPV